MARPRFPMARSPLALLVAGLLVLGACTSCGGSGDGSGAGADGGAESIRLLVFGSPEEIRGYEQMIDAFHAAQSDVRVELVTAADRTDLLTRLSTSFAAGDPPDLFMVNYRFSGQFASKGVLAPLDERLAASQVIDEADFFDPPMEAFTFDGRLTCLPQNASSLVVYFNEDAFAEAGVPLPREGWTWDEMLEAAKALTIDEDGDGTVEQYGLGVEPSIIRVAPFVWSNGGEIVDDEQRPTRLTFDTPEAKEVLQDFFDLYWTYHVVPNEIDYESEDNETRFANGRMAMVMQSRRSTSYFRSITDFTWDVAPLPVKEVPAGLLHADAYCMPKASPHQDAAWRFVEYAVGPQGAPIVAESGRTVPSMISVAESPAFLDPDEPPKHAQVFLDTIPAIRRFPAVSTWPEVEDAADTIFEIALWRVPKGPDEVAAELDEASREPFARAEYP